VKGKKLLFRADAGVRIGTGHVMRCLALAQAWQDAGGQAVFAMAGEPSSIEKRLHAENCPIEWIRDQPGSLGDANRTCELARLHHADWIIADGYRFEAGYQKGIVETGVPLLVLDDYGHSEYYWADLVLNQNIYAAEPTYSRRERRTRLLLGTQFALLRREFMKWRGRRRLPSKEVRNVLVTLGGSDPDGVTGTVIEALQRILTSDMRAVVVVGGNNPHYSALHQQGASGKGRIELKVNVSDMPALMAEVDLAISAAGSTCWELAFFGLPICCTILADNQVQVAQCLESAGAAVNLGQGTALGSQALAEQLAAIIANPDLRARLATTAATLVDGEGSRRVLEAMATVERVHS
jgi:UDP-2,4-diacetamido-2,4,6-trideoxy-beta-L-altropyranose hydrolase